MKKVLSGRAAVDHGHSVDTARGAPAADGARLVVVLHPLPSLTSSHPAFRAHANGVDAPTSHDARQPATSGIRGGPGQAYRHHRLQPSQKAAVSVSAETDR